MYGHPKFKPTWNEQTSILRSGVGIITSPQNLNSSLDPWIQGAVALNSPDAPTRYFAPLLGPGGWWRVEVPPSDPSPWLACRKSPPPFFQNMAGAWGWVSEFLNKKMCRVPPKALYLALEDEPRSCALSPLRAHESWDIYKSFTRNPWDSLGSCRAAWPYILWKNRPPICLPLNDETSH